MSHTRKKRSIGHLLGLALTVVPATWLVLRLASADVIIKAAGIEADHPGRWAKITKVASALQDPLLVTMLAAVPLGILGGGILMAIGHRHAAKMLGQVVAGVVVVGIGTTLAG